MILTLTEEEEEQDGRDRCPHDGVHDTPPGEEQDLQRRKVRRMCVEGSNGSRILTYLCDYPYEVTAPHSHSFVLDEGTDALCDAHT